jgi:hypothetical protein
MNTRPAVLPRRNRRRLLAAMVTATVLGLAGCGTLQSISVDLATFGGWPAGRAPGTYFIERLPSQQAAGPAQFPAEAAARRALEGAGFTAAAKADDADVLVQLGVRQARVLDPWVSEWGWFGGRAWRPGWGAGWGWSGRGWGPGWGPWGPAWPQDYSYDQSEAALLMVDRAKREVLYEAHARYESRNGGGDWLLPTLFSAMLQGFPQLQAGERRITVPVIAAQR